MMLSEVVVTTFTDRALHVLVADSTHPAVRTSEQQSRRSFLSRYRLYLIQNSFLKGVTVLDVRLNCCNASLNIPHAFVLNRTLHDSLDRRRKFNV
jgi:hypothetical protein